MRGIKNSLCGRGIPIPDDRQPMLCVNDHERLVIGVVPGCVLHRVAVPKRTTGYIQGD